MGAAAVLLVCLMAPPAFGQDRKFEIEAGYSGWTLAPFHPLLESRTEQAAREAFRGALGSSVLGSILSPLVATARFGDSSGQSFSATLWMRLGASRFSLGFRADAFSFRLPFTIEARESVSIFGLSLAEIDGRSTGTARIRGLGGSILGRWMAVRTRRFDLALAAGLTLFPYEGTIDQVVQAEVWTLLGDAAVSGPYDMTIDEARRLSAGRIPKALVTPSASITARWRLVENAGIFAGLASIQGVFISGGLFFAI